MDEEDCTDKEALELEDLLCDLEEIMILALECNQEIRNLEELKAYRKKLLLGEEESEITGVSEPGKN